MRTGNQEARRLEAEKLEDLLGQRPAGPGRGSATISGALRHAQSMDSGLRERAAHRIRQEGRLLKLVQERDGYSARLELPHGDLLWAWGGDELQLRSWARRASRALRTSWFGAFRRGRAMAAFTAGATCDLPAWTAGRPVDVERLAVLADLVLVESELRELARDHSGWNEAALKRERATSATGLSELSAELARAISTEALATGRMAMNERLQTLREAKRVQKSQKKLMEHIKGWAISTHSVRQLELTPKLFDLVVIDEASQCSIPAVLPLLFRARRALIIGDPMQLGHIPGISPQQERHARGSVGLSAAELEEHRLSYRDHSAFHAAAQRAEQTLLLDEHYRCHPEIADIVNGYCYAGRLKVLTDVRRHHPAHDPLGVSEPGPVLGWLDTPHGDSSKGNGGKSWVNRVEAACVQEVVEKLLDRLPSDATVGVVTPFRAQKEFLESVLRDDRLRIGTVHAFQGRQRDVMVLSPVVTANTPQGTTHWVANQVNLWNVAITRAKSQLITVGGRAFWQQQSGLPSRLAERSVVLGGYRGTDLPFPGNAAGRAQSPFSEELADAVQHHLTICGITDLERAATAGGHTADLLFTMNGENIAILIDEGPRPEDEPARHLRLIHARADLLIGLPSGGRGAKPGLVAGAIRLPAWRILAGPEALDTAFRT